MKVVRGVIKFDWDKGNIDKNLKHGVEDKESEEPFMNEPNWLMSDEKHSDLERRYLFLGQTKKARKLSIIFTRRGSKIRIISARDMDKKERRKYEEIQENPKI